MPAAAPDPSAHASAKAGALAAAVCYLAWGTVPLYWKQLANINALELIAHRAAGQQFVETRRVARVGADCDVTDGRE